LYRNTNDILTDDHFIMNKGYLESKWSWSHLNDDDNYATTQLNKLLLK
jgi:hypothetical protein